MNRTRAKKYFELPEQGFESQIFRNFPARDLNFHRREGDEIKLKQASKRDRTLPVDFVFLCMRARPLFAASLQRLARVGGNSLFGIDHCIFLQKSVLKYNFRFLSVH